MSDQAIYLIGAVVTVAASGGFATIVVRLLDRAHTEAKTTDVLLNAGETAVSLLEGQLERAVERIDALEADNAALRERVRELESQL